MSRNKALIFLVVMLASSAFSFSGEKLNFHSRIEASPRKINPKLEDITISNDWVEYTKIGGVVIEYRFEECNSTDEMGYHNTKIVVFRFTNKTNKKVKVSWSNRLFYNGECTTCKNEEHPEHAHFVELEPNSTVEGSCDKRDSNLTIPSNFIIKYPGMSDTKLTNFELINLNVDILK